jgi:molybdate transport system regulatory protein
MSASHLRRSSASCSLTHIFKEPVIDAKHGGSGGGGAELTQFGHRVVERYRSIEAKAHPAAADLDALASATLKPPPDC